MKLGIFAVNNKVSKEIFAPAAAPQFDEERLFYLIAVLMKLRMPEDFDTDTSRDGMSPLYQFIHYQDFFDKVMATIAKVEKEYSEWTPASGSIKRAWKDTLHDLHQLRHYLKDALVIKPTIVVIF